MPTGCRFHTRCPRKIGAICEEEIPPWQDAGDGHAIRCHIPVDELIALQSIPVKQADTMTITAEDSVTTGEEGDE